MINHEDKKTGRRCIFVGPNDLRQFLLAAKEHFDEQGVQIGGVVSFPGNEPLKVGASDAFNIDVNNSSINQYGKYAAIGKKLTENVALGFMGTDPDSAENTKAGRYAIMSLFNNIPKDSKLGSFLKNHPELFFGGFGPIDNDTEIVLPWQTHTYARSVQKQGGEIYIPQWNERAKLERTGILHDGATQQKKFLGFQWNDKLAENVLAYCEMHKIPFDKFFGKSRGGVIPACTLADVLNGEISSENDAQWIVEDVVDTGNSTAYLRDMRNEGNAPKLVSVAAKLEKTPLDLIPDVFALEASRYWTVNSGHESFKNGYGPDNIIQEVKILDKFPFENRIRELKKELSK